MFLLTLYNGSCSSICRFKQVFKQMEEVKNALGVKKDLSYLIDKIVASDLFWEANYYFRTRLDRSSSFLAIRMAINVDIKPFSF